MRNGQVDGQEAIAAHIIHKGVFVDARYFPQPFFTGPFVRTACTDFNSAGCGLKNSEVNRHRTVASGGVHDGILIGAGNGPGTFAAGTLIAFAGFCSHYTAAGQNAQIDGDETIATNRVLKCVVIDALLGIDAFTTRAVINFTGLGIKGAEGGLLHSQVNGDNTVAAAIIRNCIDIQTTRCISLAFGTLITHANHRIDGILASANLQNYCDQTVAV